MMTIRIAVDDDLGTRIDEWRVSQRILTRTQAVVALVEHGMSLEDARKAERKRTSRIRSEERAIAARIGRSMTESDF